MKLLLAAAILATGARAASAPAPTIEPPPGWTDSGPKGRPRGVLISLAGPEGSSFVVARMPASAADSAASTRAYLSRTLDQIVTGSRMAFKSGGRVETKTFRNGATIHFLRADLDGKPRLIVAEIEAGGPPLLGTLASAAPDAMMGPLFGALRVGVDGAVKTAGEATSLDGQLAVSLGGGLRSRAPTPEEKEQGVQLAIQENGAEVVFLKVAEEDAAPKDQAAIVRDTVADGAKAPLDSVSAPRRASTAAGPSAVYAWAKIPASPDQRFAAGYLPWQYWGYSALARGPRADEMLVGALAAVRQGPSAVPGLVAASPRIEIPDEPLRASRALGAGAVVAVLAALAAWSARRKKATFPS